MSRTIFYSWQSDVEPNKHRYFIQRCLISAIGELEQSANLYMEYDRDTAGQNGSPDITQTIFEKIDKCVLFVCDVSIINSSCESKKTPNPNVLIELGYAVSKLGWDRVICLFDGNTGKIEDLPFDLRQKRITVFEPEKGKAEEKRISQILMVNIKNLFVAGKLFNPLNDYMKGRIDKNLLDICKQLSNMLFGTVSMSDGLTGVKGFLQLESSTVTDKIGHAEFPGFIVLNNYYQTSLELREVLKEILSSSYFSREWTYTVLEAIEWIRSYVYLISERNPYYPLEVVNGKLCDNYVAILGESINPTNPQNSYIILETFDKEGRKYIDAHGGRVINTTQYPIDRTNGSDPLKKLFRFKKDDINKCSDILYRFIGICQRWLDITDSEFILNPDYYLIQ